MCGIVGFVNYKQDISKYKNILINMNHSLSRRGPDEDGYYIRKNVAMAHKRLIVIDPEGGKQPMITDKICKMDRFCFVTKCTKCYCL